MIFFMVYMNFVIDIVPKINIGTENGKLKDENIQKNDSQKIWKIKKGEGILWLESVKN